MLLIPALRGQPGLHFNLQDSQGYIERACLEKKKKKKNSQESIATWILWILVRGVAFL
jgi:hypothetical protein